MSRALQRTIDAAQVLVLSLQPFEGGLDTADDYWRCRTAVAQLTDAARSISECMLRARTRVTAGSLR